MDNILEVRNLHKQLDGFALHDIDFELPYGCIMGLIGPNGSGKTSLLRLIMDLYRKDGGNIKIFGQSLRFNEVYFKDRIGFMQENPRFYKEFTLEQNADIISGFYSEWSWATFKDFFLEFDLPIKKKFGKLSLGEKKKFAIALALSHKAELILLDEPIAGLDPIFRRKCLDLLAEHIQNEKRSILISTHITSDLDRVADYIVMLSGGRIVFNEDKEYLLNNWGIVKCSNELLDKHRSKFCGVRVHNYGSEGLTKHLYELKKLLKDSAKYEKPTLEDIMNLHS